jgi:hypothetical protein
MSRSSYALKTEDPEEQQGAEHGFRPFFARQLL